jgi:hypothetical protein
MQIVGGNLIDWKNSSPEPATEHQNSSSLTVNSARPYAHSLSPLTSIDLARSCLTSVYSTSSGPKKVPQLKLPGKNDRQSGMLRSRSSRRISKYVGSMAMGSARESKSEIDALGPAYSVNSARGLQSADEGTPKTNTQTFTQQRR